MEPRTPACKVETLALVHKESDPYKFRTSNAGRVFFAALEVPMASISPLLISSPESDCSPLASGLETGKESLRRLGSAILRSSPSSLWRISSNTFLIASPALTG